jgi:microcystin-dependent protein
MAPLIESMIGSIILWPATSAPRGWAFCDGTLLPIVQYRTLYSLIGNTYGGGGDTFALPDLRAQAPPTTRYLMLIAAGVSPASE